MKKSNLIRTIILAGSLLLQLNTFCFQSHGAAGDVDLSFDPGSGVNGPVNYIAVQPDGKALIGGNFGIPSLRLNTDGSRDSPFIASSFNPPDLTAALWQYDDCYSLCGCWKLATPSAGVVQADGKVFISGMVTTYVSCVPDGGWEVSRVVFARFNADGSFDSSFGPVIGDPNGSGSVNALAVQPDGKIIVGGNFFFNGIARLNANGSLDSSFNPGTGANGSVNAIAVESDGKVLIGGSFTAVNGTNRKNIARLNASGSLDNSFSTGTGPDAAVLSIALQPDGNVLIGGDFYMVNGAVRPFIARLYGDSVAPSLHIAQSNAFVIVSWPATGLNFQLQEATDLSLPNSWSPVTQPAVTNASQIFVTVPTTVGQKFFRLKSQ